MGPSFLKPFLLPLSLLYGAGVRAHRGLYRAGWRQTRCLPRAVVSVGNLAAGGGGKTPLVIWLARELSEAGVRVAVLSRGYGRRDPRSIRLVSRGAGPVLSPELAGDEPFLIASRVPKATVAVSPGRYEGGMAVLRETPVDLFLLDDGFSHHRLARDLDILTVDARRRFGDGRLLPAGFLREPLSRIADAGQLVVTKADKVDPEFDQVVLGRFAGPVAWSSFLPDHLVVPGETSQELPLSSLRNRKVFLFSGIADPVSFEASAVPLCGEVVGRLRFGDHHAFTPADVRRLEKRSQTSRAEVLLTTEKDLARLPASLRPSRLLCALVMGISFLQGEKQLRSRVLSLVERSRG